MKSNVSDQLNFLKIERAIVCKMKVIIKNHIKALPFYLIFLNKLHRINEFKL